MPYRTEKDIMGKVNVPADSYYGAFTVRADEKIGNVIVKAADEAIDGKFDSYFIIPAVN